MVSSAAFGVDVLRAAIVVAGLLPHQECIVDDDADMDEASQVCLLNTLQPGGSLVAAGKQPS